jgi:hypothetical protein
MDSTPIAQKNLTFIAPKAEDLDNGAEYMLHIGPFPDAEGEILVRRPAERWRTEFKSGLFTVFDPAEREILRVSRDARVPPRFSLLAGGNAVGTMASRPLMRNRYVVNFAAGETWAFHLKLFTVFFPGESAGGKKLWVRVGPSKKQWSLLIQPGADDPRLVAALAFMHREWWFHG